MFIFVVAGSIFFGTSCSKESATENNPVVEKQMEQSKMSLLKTTKNSISGNTPMGVPPPPPGFSIHLSTFSYQCISSGIQPPKIKIDISLETNSYKSSLTHCFRFWYKKSPSTTWQSLVICNATQNAYTFSLPNGNYEIKVGDEIFTTAANSSCSTIYNAYSCP